MTSAKALAFFENPSAIAEGAANAPRVAQKVILPTIGTGTATFSGFTGWQGVVVNLSMNNTGGSTARQVSIAVGDGTFATATNIFEIPITSGVGQFQVFVDFVTGAYKASWLVLTTTGTASGTLALPAGDVTEFQVNAISGDVLIGGIAIANGGASTT
jgi:hypothetical protein